MREEYKKKSKKKKEINSLLIFQNQSIRIKFEKNIFFTRLTSMIIGFFFFRFIEPIGMANNIFSFKINWKGMKNYMKSNENNRIYNFFSSRLYNKLSLAANKNSCAELKKGSNLGLYWILYIDCTIIILTALWLFFPIYLILRLISTQPLIWDCSGNWGSQ